MFQNIDKKLMGVKNYKDNNSPKTQKMSKDPLEFERKEEIADEMLTTNSVGEQTKILNGALDKILATHRNSRMFLFMLSGPFFLWYMVLKYSLKAVFFTYIYRRNKRAKAKLEAQALLDGETPETYPPGQQTGDKH